MKIAAIDIGSNAIRLQIVKVFEENKRVSFKKLEFLRFPLRLGKDVFKKKAISKETREKFAMLMGAFKTLIDLYEVDHYAAVATSAMREAKNGNSIQKEIKALHNLDINIISGAREARLLRNAISPFVDKQKYLHIDVGGGSTELNIFDQGKILAGRSFKIGSVRKLTKKENQEVKEEMKHWIYKNELNSKSGITCIGTGGNINKLYKIANKGIDMFIPIAELKGLKAYVRAFSLDERKSFLKMNPDRADVIIPASDIYIHAMKTVGSPRIMVPKVGLKDGLIYELYAKNSRKKVKDIQFFEE